MVSYSAKLDSSTKQHTQFGVSASNGSRVMARTKVAEKKKNDFIKHPLRGSLNMRFIASYVYLITPFEPIIFLDLFISGNIEYK